MYKEVPRPRGVKKYLISLVLENSLKFTTLTTPDIFSVKLDHFAEENLAHPRRERTCKTHG